MHTSGLLLLLFVSLSAALKTDTFQTPPKHSIYTAELTSINEALIGERYFNYYMYGTLRNGFNTEKFTAEYFDGKPVYKVETHDVFRFPELHLDQTFSVILSTDFSIVSRHGRLITEDINSGEKTAIDISCRGQSPDRLTCDYATNGGAPERIEYQTPNGEPITFEQTLARAMPWDKNPVIVAYSIFDLDHEIRKYVMSQNGMRSFSLKPGQIKDAREILFQYTDKGTVNYTMWHDDEYGFLGGELNPKSVASALVLRTDLPQPELASRPDPTTMPLEQLSPTQTMAAFAIASMEKDTDEYLQFIDVKCIYDFIVSESADQDIMSYEQFKKDFHKSMQEMEIMEMGNDKWRAYLIKQFPDYPLHTVVDAIMHNTYEAAVQGNSATLTDRSDGSTKQLYRYDGVWKICILDELFDESDLEDSEDQE